MTYKEVQNEIRTKLNEINEIIIGQIKEDVKFLIEYGETLDYLHTEEDQNRKQEIKKRYEITDFFDEIKEKLKNKKKE